MRWGILSTAGIATEKAIPGFRRAARCEVVAIGSRDAGRARAVAERHGIARVHRSYEGLLADPDVDAVYVPLPNHLHAEWTIAAARAGKHVLCEKPLALAAADAERMIDVCRDGGRPPDGGLHVPAAPLVGGRPRPRRIRRHRPPGSRQHLVLVLQRRSREHPQHSRLRRRSALRHRLLRGQPVADALRRRAAAGRGLHRPRPDQRGGRPDQRPPGVRRRGRHVHLLHPAGARPAGPRLRDRGPDLDRHPVQHPTRPADQHLRDGGRRPTRGAGDPDADLRARGSLRRRGGAVRRGRPRRRAHADVTGRRRGQPAGHRAALRGRRGEPSRQGHGGGRLTIAPRGADWTSRPAAVPSPRPGLRRSAAASGWPANRAARRRDGWNPRTPSSPRRVAAACDAR